MDHNQPQQQPRRNPSPRSTTKDDNAPAVSPRGPNPDSETKDSRTPYQASRRPRPRTTEASHTPAVSPRPGGPGAETTRRYYYSSSEMYPLATKRAYSLAINISSGDSTTQLT